MKLNIKNTIEYFATNPLKLFLLDGTGALLTALSLFFILRPCYEYTGIPAGVLAYLSIFGLVYAAYSFSCFLLLKGRIKAFLRTIAFGNLLYCIVTLTMLFYQFSSLTLLGLTYFTVETGIIMVLVYIELKVAKEIIN